MKQTIYRFVSLPILLVMAVCLSVGCGWKFLRKVTPLFLWESDPRFLSKVTPAA